MKAVVFLLALVATILAVNVDQALLKEFHRSKTADVIVFLNEYLDIDTFVYNGKKLLDYEVEERAKILVEQLQKFASESQKEIVERLQKDKMEYDVMWNVNGLLIKKVDLKYVSSFLAKNAKIEQVLLNKKVDVEEIETKSIQIENPKKYSAENSSDIIEWNLEWVKAPAVWKLGFEGQGIIVGVGDTGLNHQHEAIVNSYAGTQPQGKFDHNYHWHDPSGRTKAPSDFNGHGTHCSGTVAGGNGIKRKIGVAPKAKLIHCLALVNIAAQVQCMQWWLAPTDENNRNPNTSKRPHVVSHSYNNWSCAPSCSPQYERATKALIASGIATINSAGNRGPRCGSINPNSRYPDMVSVCSTGKNTDTISSFSSRGPNPENASILKPNVCAPGEQVVSAQHRSNNGYTAMSGTSMSTPNVAGGVALLWSAVPELKRDIKTTNKILDETSKKQRSDVCEPKGSPNGVYGHGTVDYLKAVQRAQEMFKH